MDQEIFATTLESNKKIERKDRKYNSRPFFNLKGLVWTCESCTCLSVLIVDPLHFYVCVKEISPIRGSNLHHHATIASVL